MKILEKLKTIKITQKQQKIIILISIFIMMVVLNFLTPLIADDYSYSFGINNERITNIIDIILKQANHYMTWGGRSIAHTLANLFLMFPKAIFNVLNSFMYTFLVHLIYKHAKTKKEDNSIMLVLIHLGLYFLLPVFGQNCLWLIGSCNYLWTTVIILLILLEYRENSHKEDSLLRIIGMLLLGIIAGWTNENTSFGLIVITLMSIFIFKRKSKIEKYKISGLIGSILGFIIMIVAPGNFVRSKHFVDNQHIIIKLIKRVINCTTGIIDYMLILIIIIIILFTIYIYKKQKIHKKVYIYIAGAFFTVYSMALSPEFPERSWFGVVIFMLIAVITLMYNLEKISNIYKYIIIDVALIGTFLYIGDYLNLAGDIYELNSVWKYRIETIEQGKKEGITDFEFSSYYPDNVKVPSYGLIDIHKDAHEWPNHSIEDYYKINSIQQPVEEKEGNI